MKKSEPEGGGEDRIGANLLELCEPLHICTPWTSLRHFNMNDDAGLGTSGVLPAISRSFQVWEIGYCDPVCLCKHLKECKW